MNKTSSILAATFISTFSVALIASVWTLIIPTVIFDSQQSWGRIINSTLQFVFIAAIIAGIIVVVFGIPIYLALEKVGALSMKNLAIAGFIIPLGIYFILTFQGFSEGTSTYSSGQNYYGTYRQMVIENERTLWGWIRLSEEYLTFGIYGLIGATIFGRVVSRLQKKREQA